MITLIGHGYIGTAIAQELERLGHNFAWVTHKTFIPKGMVIINAAGYTGDPNVDACEEHKEECIQGNVLWPMELEKRCAGLPIVHVTSGCVYTGYDKQWEETDIPNFDMSNGSFYSGCKALTDKRFRENNKNSYLLRIRMPFGKADHPKNLLTKLKNYPRIINQFQSVSHVDDVAGAAVWFALHKPEPGIYNCVNPKGVWTRDICNAMGWDKEYMDRDEFEYVTAAPRSECVLSSEKMQAVYEMRTSSEALEACL